jgi:hypothetical protein
LWVLQARKPDRGRMPLQTATIQKKRTTLLDVSYFLRDALTHVGIALCAKAKREVQIRRIECRPGGAGGGRPRPTCVASASAIEATGTIAIPATTTKEIRICEIDCSDATGCGAFATVLQHGCCRVPMWQLPTIFLQHAISAPVIREFGAHASAGTASHRASKPETTTERQRTMTRCYISSACLGKLGVMLGRNIENGLRPTIASPDSIR